MAVGMILFCGLIVALVFVAAQLSTRSSRGSSSAVTGESTCGRCGYIVRGITSLNCPECGSDLREVGIVTSTMRRQSGTIGAIVAWTLLVFIAGLIAGNLILSALPRLHEQIDSFVMRSSKAGIQSLNIEFRAWHYMGRGAKQPMRPPLREIILVGSTRAAPASTLTIDVDEMTCSIDGQAASPWSLSAVASWFTAMGLDPKSNLFAVDSSEFFAEVDRAIKANDPTVNLSFMSTAGSGGRGRSGMEPPWVWESMMVIWVLIWITGCVWIYRRHQQRSVIAPG